MIRVLVVSDSHGDIWRLRDIIAAQPDAKYIFHLGDNSRDIEKIADELTGKYICSLRGNCDYGSSQPLCAVDEIGGVRVYATHGHEERVKYGSGGLIAATQEQNCAIALYGHTHRAATQYADGVLLFNPGAVLNGEYGVIDIAPNGFLPTLMKLR